MRAADFLPLRWPTRLAAALALTVLVAWWAWRLDAELAQEDGWLETAQAALLFSAAAAAAWQAWQLPRRTLLRLGVATLALLAFSLGLREVDIDRIGGGWPRLETALRAGALALWALLLPWGLWRLWRSGLRALAQPPLVRLLVLVGLAALFFIASWPLDKALWLADTPALALWLEEVAELCGSQLLLAAAWPAGRVPPIAPAAGGTAPQVPPT